MSDLHMYELDDIAWDEFDQIDDHIVPQPSNEHASEPAFQDDGCKKPRHEVIGVASNADGSFATKYVNQEEEGITQPPKKKWTKLLEKDSLKLAEGEGVIPNSRDGGSNWVATTVSADSIRVPGHFLSSSNAGTMGEEFCTDDTIAGEGCAGNDSNSCPYSLADVSQTENNLSFLDNDCEDNESTDLFYYGWPDIENFEDVDRMFSCDSTVGFGISNEDDLTWLSSSHYIEEVDGMLKSDFKVSCPELSLKTMPEDDLSKQKSASLSVNDSSIGSSYISYQYGIQGSEINEADPLGNLALNSSAVSDGKGEFTPKEQALEFDDAVHFDNSNGNLINGNGQRKKQTSRPKVSEGKRRNQHQPRKVFLHPEHQKQQKNLQPSSFGYLQTSTPYMHLNYVQPSDQISVGSQPSGIKSEIDSFTCLSPRESSYASNQARSMENSHFHPLTAPVMSVEDKLEKLRRRKGLYVSSVSKQVPHSQYVAENHNGVNRANVTIPVDIYSSNVPETSCMSSGFDEISLEASSFRQLQQVVEQLDIRTKLCIRDSLYRLARSAEQRHRYASMKGGGPSHSKTGDAFIAEGSKNGLMDMETDTNPIDRSVAHLLFHRPSDPSVLPAHDVSSLKSHTMIHGSIPSPPVLAEQLVCKEEVASEAEKKVLVSDDG